MNSPVEYLFSTRPAYVLDLPLKDEVRILHPERVILRIGSYHLDVGALCYALRSDQKRKPGQPAKVVLASFIKQRPKQIIQVIKILSAMLQGKSPETVKGISSYIKVVMDWADGSGHSDCLAGGDATCNAYRAFVAHVEDRFQRQQIGSASASRLQKGALELLEAITGEQGLARGVRIIKNNDWVNGGTEPAPDYDFAKMLALSQSLFDGLCDLVLNRRSFPYKLDLPNSLGWSQCHLWLFPNSLWRLPPHLLDSAVRQKMGKSANWAYDYQHGRLATVDEIWHRYKMPTESGQRKWAVKAIQSAQRQIDASNANPRDRWRFTLAMLAHNAFCWLLHANTGANQQPILDLETDGTLDKVVANQGFRVIKFRASGKEVPITIPISFMPSLQRFMELRTWLLNGATCPHLFFTFGFPSNRKSTPEKASDNILSAHSYVLRGIDPKLKVIRAQRIRATVNDQLLRKNDAMVVAKLLGHTEATELKKYGRGSQVDHRVEMTYVLEKISTVAKKQAIIPMRADLGKKAKELEQGGSCAHYGHPKAIIDDPALQPDCARGCWFCNHRMLVADELDARKVASAAFVMEQLILGPQHETKLRPLIVKCETDLESIAQTRDCRAMTERVRKDVYEDGNLTPYWAEKYHLFLELEVIV